MKKIILLLLCAPLFSQAYAQQEEDFGKIALSVIMPDNVENLDASQVSKLQTKITQLVTISGLAASGTDQNFVLYPTFAVYESAVVESGMQDITVMNCEVTLFIKDYENNVIFSTVSKSLKGTGKSKNLAITSAISKMNVNDPDFKAFITTGKARIIEYFNAKCEMIIQNAFTLVKQERFDEAIYNLSLVPEVCEDCYYRCLDTMESIYALKINAECQNKLQEANITWAASQNTDGAEKIVGIIKEINPLADCQPEVEILMKKINDKLRADEKTRWEFEMRQYRDSVAAQRARFEFEIKKHNDEIELEKERERNNVDININNYYIDNKPATNRNNSVRSGSNSNSQRVNQNNSMVSRSSDGRYRRNLKLDQMRKKEYRNVGMAYAQSKPRRLNYNTVSRN
jgi:hypothetical protein